MTARVLGPGDGQAGLLGSIGVRFLLDGDETGGGCALVEHPMPPRARGTASPPQSRGRVQLRPRGPRRRAPRRRGGARRGRRPDLQAARAVAHVLERRLATRADSRADLPGRGSNATSRRSSSSCDSPVPEASALSGIAARYGLEFDRESIPRLTQQYDLHFGPRRNRSDRALLRAVGSGQLDGLEEHRLERPVAGVPLDLREIASATSCPEVMRPKTVCLPSSQGHASAVTMKNCEPFVSGLRSPSRGSRARPDGR